MTGPEGSVRKDNTDAMSPDGSVGGNSIKYRRSSAARSKENHMKKSSIAAAFLAPVAAAALCAFTIVPAMAQDKAIVGLITKTNTNPFFRF